MLYDQLLNDRNALPTLYIRAGEIFWGRVPKFSLHFQEIISRDHGNFEDQNKVLESSIININYCININAYYN